MFHLIETYNFMWYNVRGVYSIFHISYHIQEILYIYIYIHEILLTQKAIKIQSCAIKVQELTALHSSLCWIAPDSTTPSCPYRTILSLQTKAFDPQVAYNRYVCNYDIL